MKITHITITPIGKGRPASTVRARTDFNEQRQRNFGIHADEFWCWDDTSQNTSQAGQLFAFRNHNTGMFTIHRIVSVNDPSHRLESWSQNVGQTDRNVLELSHPLLHLPIHCWELLGGSAGHMGTHRSNKGFRDDDLLYRQLICTLSDPIPQVEEEDMLHQERPKIMEQEEDMIVEEVDWDPTKCLARIWGNLPNSKHDGTDQCTRNPICGVFCPQHAKKAAIGVGVSQYESFGNRHKYTGLTMGRIDEPLEYFHDLYGSKVFPVMWVNPECATEMSNAITDGEFRRMRGKYNQLPCKYYFQEYATNWCDGDPTKLPTDKYLDTPLRPTLDLIKDRAPTHRGVTAGEWAQEIDKQIMRRRCCWKIHPLIANEGPQYSPLPVELRLLSRPRRSGCTANEIKLHLKTMGIFFRDSWCKVYLINLLFSDNHLTSRGTAPDY